ncbi:MAG: hypothetical protein ABIJ01_07990 [Pseudomonadota bacterium]
MKKQTIVSLAIGSAFTAAALIPVAHAAGDNPFGASKLQSGYQIADADNKMKDGKCGEATCGADKKAADPKGEAKRGADKKMDMKSDAKAGEAKCGASKK